MPEESARLISTWAPSYVSRIELARIARVTVFGTVATGKLAPNRDAVTTWAGTQAAPTKLRSVDSARRAILNNVQRTY